MLQDKEIKEVFKALGLLSEAERQRILALAILDMEDRTEKTEATMNQIVADNVTSSNEEGKPALPSSPNLPIPG